MHDKHRASNILTLVHVLPPAIADVLRQNNSLLYGRNTISSRTRTVPWVLILIYEYHQVFDGIGDLCRTRNQITDVYSCELLLEGFADQPDQGNVGHGKARICVRSSMHCC